MKNIAVFGAGRSTYYLFEYLNRLASEDSGYTIRVYDANKANLEAQLEGLTHLQAHVIDVASPLAVQHAIMQCDVAVSMLPPALHMKVAGFCIEHEKHLATASYVSPEMRSLHHQAVGKGLIFINELGLDPGIDHMSAMRIIQRLKNSGAEITGFESHCGGLIREEDVAGNPWKYKFTWNPMNVVTAGKAGMATYRHNGLLKCIPYHSLFRRTDTFNIPGYGRFEAYANRDSLSYESAYGIKNIPTLYRGTFRRPGYCSAWQVLVQLGMTDTDTILNQPGLNGKEFLSFFLPDSNLSMQESVQQLTGAGEAEINALEWLGLFHEQALPLSQGTPAEILLELLKTKWDLGTNDRDQVVMLHRFSYRKNNEEHELNSWLVVEGHDHRKTAMAKTVGLPLAMGVRLICEGKITEKGVLIPVSAQWYEPILLGLEAWGIRFTETEEALPE
ncbi:MAG: saccharopine dehydrogenase NADP-binding domain-containing protein [Bacteroidetes bacterium]|nr:saccharopine dehydrogenase NADP-binding domain-containing protein [Bacteroidota bacterium]